MPPIVVGFGQGRIQYDGLVVIRQGRFGLAEGLLHDAAIVVGFGQGRIQYDGLVVIRQGRFGLAEAMLREAAIVVSKGIGRVQRDGFGVGIYCCFPITLLSLEIADGEPGPRLKLGVFFSRNSGDGTPLVDGLLNVSLSLKQDGGGNRPVYRRRCLISSDPYRSPSSFAWVGIDDLGIQLFQLLPSLISGQCELPGNILDSFHLLGDLVSGLFCLLDGLIDFLKTNIADNDSENAEDPQDYDQGGEPPLDDP